jgi:hypothetical protein
VKLNGSNPNESDVLSVTNGGTGNGNVLISGSLSLRVVGGAAAIPVTVTIIIDSTTVATYVVSVPVGTTLDTVVPISWGASLSAGSHTIKVHTHHTAGNNVIATEAKTLTLIGPGAL